ncbi:hypothetical predicted multi-pass transmembrane protein [Leishmania braziliensis MHOM/BR/75/M2904]|uniref:Hypothetical predicted multi-pass transmembrane protein n=2 Tax=Leishmania braziliensis TaxID=5660 RepID=A4HDP6_LEIBR|nr:hypothetical predicted multi-pass transmembrane protein [Leishmania braziliensis MHOM/BR/75/M2904]KAI5688236.1 hypothetical protein MNV84_04279 [Leishmania braziliensis]CAJ2473823.1 unnamed protein product [Leishmania braziliensis]CAM42367.1 hypothetical predicted multi-pass transmembrane protein [Leishmania braziliensis MHOM/BR/75/M2904]SYZ66356.1 hypothetical_protein [Leishmania braziliensis MHOM/BR/75/M2904]
MQRSREKRTRCRRAGVWTASSAVVAVLCALLCSCCLAGTAVEQEPLVLHTSLVDLLNAENALWTVSLGTLNAAGQLAEWTAMREVRVETQPSESAASLLFTLPPPISLKHRIEDAEEGKYDEEGAATEKRGAMPSDDVSTRTHRRKSFRGVSCEEYRTGGRGQQGAMQGRCFFLRDDGEDFFVRYRVKSPDTEEAKSGGEEGAASKTTTAVHRHRPRRAPAKAAASQQAKTSSDAEASGTEPWTVHSTSASDVWAERILPYGGSAAAPAERGAGATEEHARIGDVTIDEYIRELPDAHRSKKMLLTFAMLMVPKSTALAVQRSDDVMHVRLECLTGAFYEDMVRRSTAAVKASRTSVFHRWVCPVLLVTAIYVMVSATVRLVAWRKASLRSGARPIVGAAKKQQ